MSQPLVEIVHLRDSLNALFVEHDVTIEPTHPVELFDGDGSLIAEIEFDDRGGSYVLWTYSPSPSGIGQIGHKVPS
jgi:hypothetical protein